MRVLLLALDTDSAQKLRAVIKLCIAIASDDTVVIRKPIWRKKLTEHVAFDCQVNRLSLTPIAALLLLTG